MMGVCECMLRHMLVREVRVIYECVMQSEENSKCIFEWILVRRLSEMLGEVICRLI